jgi:hypothetical protein
MPFYGLHILQKEITMKKCPYCLAELHDAALLCPYCNSDVMVTVPLRVVVKQNTLEQAKKRRGLITLIIVSFSITVLAMSIVVALMLLWNFY